MIVLYEVRQDYTGTGTLEMFLSVDSRGKSLFWQLTSSCRGRVDETDVLFLHMDWRGWKG